MNRLISAAAIVFLSASVPAYAQAPQFPTVQPEIGSAPIIPNPFDAVPVEAPPLPALVEDDVNVAPVAPQDPTSLPTGLRHRHRRSPVDAMVDQATLAGVQTAHFGAIDWGYGSPKAPNHVASMLLREECVDGLWANYPAMRAAECELMWKRLTATKRCCQCKGGCSGGCGSCGCDQTGGCASGNCGQVVNRYTQGCDSCGH